MTVEDVPEVISNVCKVVILFCATIIMVVYAIAVLMLVFK